MRIGALFAGYGGLEHGVQAVLGGDVAWYSEIDKGALKILHHRYPDTPNVGDITTVDWAAVEPVDILTGGFPCQDVSHAGKRGGLRPDTRTGLWSQMAYAIDQLRPRLVVAENVRGLLSAEAHSDVEPCPWCMGDGEGLSPLRALGAVLGDLADLGYDAAWHGLRAADVGAPHGRFRVFVAAYPRGEAGDVRARLRADEPARDGRRQSPRNDREAGGPLVQVDELEGVGAGNGVGDGVEVRCPVALDELHPCGVECSADGGLHDVECRGGLACGDECECSHGLTVSAPAHGVNTPAAKPQRLLATPTSAIHTGGPPQDSRGKRDLRLDLLPTPTGRDGKGRNQRDDDTCLTGALLPTPRATDGTKGGPNQRGSSGDLMLPSAVQNLLPTPAVNDMGAAYTPDQWDAWTDRMKAAHGNGNGHGKSLAIEAQRLLPSPTAQTFGTQHGNDPTRQTVYSLDAMAAKGMLCDGRGGKSLDVEARLLPTPTVEDRKASGGGYNGQTNVTLSDATVRAPSQWGDYADAIARWEHTLGRPAPAPTMTSAKGNPQLSPAFVEWMMGLPPGWVTDTPGITRNEALKALGNGVVPQQAEAALRFLLRVVSEADT